MKVILLLVGVLIVYSAEGQLWKVYADSAKVLYDREEYTEAIPHYTKSVEELKKDSSGTLTYAKIISELATIYHVNDSEEVSNKLFLEAKSIREKKLGKNHPDYAKSCYDVARTYMGLKKFSEAEFFFNESLIIREKIFGKEHPEYAESCYGIAAMLADVNKFKQAESYYLIAKRIYNREFGKESLDYSSVCINLSSLYSSLGELEKAEEIDLEACEIKKKKYGDKSSAYAFVLNNLAGLYDQMGQYEKAEKLYIESQALLEKEYTRSSPFSLMGLFNLADLYLKTSQYKKAEELLLEIKPLFEEAFGKESTLYASVLQNLAAISHSMNLFEKAEALNLEAMKIYENSEGRESGSVASLCFSLAALYQDMDNDVKAETLFLESLSTNKKIFGESHIQYINSCIGLANFYRKTHRIKQAQFLFSEAFKGHYSNIEKVFRFTSEREKHFYMQRDAELENKYKSFISAEYPDSSGGFMYDVSLQYRNLILSSVVQLRQTINRFNDINIKAKYSQWVEIKEQLSDLYTKPVAQRSDYLNSLEQTADKLEKELTLLSADFRKEQQEFSWKKVQQSLKGNEAAIEFSEFNYYNGQHWTDDTYYIALILRKDRPEPELVKLFEKKQLEGVLNKAITWGDIDSLYSSPLSYQLIWQPLEKYLTDISKVYFAPAGLLHKINMAAISIGKNKVLSEQYQLVQLNTTASVSNQPNIFITPSDKIAMYGGIDFNADSIALKAAAKFYQTTDENGFALRGFNISADQLPDLPYSEEEVDYITNAARLNKYSINTMKGVAANEESVKALNGKKSPGVFHFATHGKFFPDPVELKSNESLSGGKTFSQADNPLLRSMLLLAGSNRTWIGKPIAGIQDGVLTAYEISNMYLPNTKLVVLSACETGLGDIQGSEGVYGLQRAFKMAGVENLIMSLWSVPDNTTAEFMQLFYEHLFEKKSINDSFKEAQTTMKNKYRANPSRWAGLILVR